VLQDCGWRIGGPGNAAERLQLKRTTLLSRMRKRGIRRPGHSSRAKGSAASYLDGRPCLPGRVPGPEARECRPARRSDYDRGTGRRPQAMEHLSEGPHLVQIGW
jgi:hypothetical protein